MSVPIERLQELLWEKQEHKTAYSRVQLDHPLNAEIDLLKQLIIEAGGSEDNFYKPSETTRQQPE